MFPYAYTGDPFFEVDELAARLQISIDATDPSAVMLAQLASDAVREDLRSTVDYIANDVLTVYGDNSETLVLPERPITAVSAVSMAGQSLVPVQVNATSTLLMYDWRPDGRLYRVVYGGSFYAGELYFNWPAGVPVTVTYSHGYQTVPTVFKRVALELAAAAYANPDMAKVQSTGRTRIEPAFVGLSLTAFPDLRSDLDLYRRLDL
jgi:hypothetical protein